MTQTIINVPAAGAFDPTDIEITDGVDDAFLIKDTGGNEWFKIDTRTGTGSDCINMAYTSGQRVLIGKPASAGQGPYSPFQVINGNLDSQAVRIYGSANYDTTNQLTWGGPSNQPAMIHPYGLLFRSSASTGTFQFQDSSNADMFALDDDSNATFTLNDSNSAVFKVQDDAGTPHEYINVDTTSGSERILLKGRPSASSSGLWLTDQPFVQGPRSNFIQMAGFGVAIESGIAGGRIDNRIGNSGNNFRILGTGNAERFKVLDDSNATFTLDDGSGATFTITDNASPTPALHLRCTESAIPNPSIEVNGLVAFPTRQLTLSSNTYGTAFSGSTHQARLSVSLGATSATRNVNIGAVNMDAFAQILTATPSTTGQTFTLDFNNTSTALSGLPISLYKLVLKNAGTQSCTFTAASTMASGGRVKGVDISGASIGVIDSSSGSITAAAGETIYVEVTNHVSDSAGGLSNRFIICKTICKI